MNKKKQPETEIAVSPDVKDVYAAASESALAENEKNGEDGEIAKLKAEIERLETENRQFKENAEKLTSEKNRMEKEVAEFSEYFPEVSLGEVPDTVWEEVKNGLSLTAAYAKHERRVKLQKQKIDEANASNGSRSSGSVKNASDFYFSPDEVRRMTPSEVKNNYTHIINSMKHWN